MTADCQHPENLGAATCTTVTESRPFAGPTSR